MPYDLNSKFATPVKIVEAAANINLDIDPDSPLPTKPAPGETWPVAENGGALTALQALAATIASGSLKAVLQAGANAIGKLAANASGVLIGQIEIAAGQAVQLAASSAAIGKLAANAAGVLIGQIEIAAGQAVQLAAGTNAIGKVADSLPTGYVTLQATVGVAAAQLTATPTPVKTQPILKAEAANGGTVYLIQDSSGTTSTGVPIAGGDPLPVPVDDLSKIWLIGSAANLKIAAVAGV